MGTVYHQEERVANLEDNAEDTKSNNTLDASNTGWGYAPFSNHVRILDQRRGSTIYKRKRTQVSTFGKTTVVFTLVISLVSCEVIQKILKLII